MYPNKTTSAKSIDALASEVISGKCGAWYGLKTWHSNDEYRRQIYRCNDKYKVKGHPCKSPHFTEDEIKGIFLKALNSLIKVKKTALEEIRTFIENCVSLQI